MFNASGELAEAYRYTPLGDVETASALGNPYHFTGRRLDEETCLYYYRARMYDPSLGRFLQPDPIGIAGGVNLYRYVGNGYTGYIDPYGLVNWGAVGEGVLAIISGGTAIIIVLPGASTGVGAIAAIPIAIIGSATFSWGISQFIAGWMDSEIPLPEPTPDFLLALLITQDLETSSDYHAWFNYILSLLEAHKLLNSGQLPSLLEAIESISDISSSLIDMEDTLNEDKK